MIVRAKEPCYVERQFHEAGEVFEWRNSHDEPLPACMEAVKQSEPETPEPEPEQMAERRRPGRPPKKQG